MLTASSTSCVKADLVRNGDTPKFPREIGDLFVGLRIRVWDRVYLLLSVNGRDVLILFFIAVAADGNRRSRTRKRTR
jgi:hypothetical protein